uniref:Uncharacterized protein n=1 Tax=Mastacembelus armatus TaxID=205130 RepID=A0A3Q3S375_9TELE
MEKGLICGDCNMVFHSTSLLEKHKALFCIGSEIGSEIGSIRVQRHTSETVMRNNAGGMDPKQMRTPDLVQIRNQPRNIGRWRSVDAEPKSGRTEDKPMASQTNSALQILTDEFHKLRMSIEQNLPNWSKGITDTEVNRHKLGHSEKLKHMREMAAVHEHQLALIHAHNQQLEQQRDELAHQVSVLSEQSSTTHLEILLMELREQEQRNEETLQHLAEHLQTLHEQQVSAPANETGPHKNEKIYHHNLELISVDGPLSTQIRALRQAYMQSGGSDPSIVAQMIDLQAEAQSLEKNQPTATTKAKKKKIKSPRRSLSWELLAVEQENQRLEEEILRIQLARGRHHDYEALTAELELIQMDTLQQITGLQAEMEKSKEAQKPRRPHPLPPHPFPRQAKSHIHAPLSLVYSSQSLRRLVLILGSHFESLGQ